MIEFTRAVELFSQQFNFDFHVENVTENFFNLIGHSFSSQTKFLCGQIFKIYEYQSFQESSR